MSEDANRTIQSLQAQVQNLESVVALLQKQAGLEIKNLQGQQELDTFNAIAQMDWLDRKIANMMDGINRQPPHWGAPFFPRLHSLESIYTTEQTAYAQEATSLLMGTEENEWCKVAGDTISFKTTEKGKGVYRVTARVQAQLDTSECDNTLGGTVDPWAQLFTYAKLIFQTGITSDDVEPGDKESVWFYRGSSAGKSDDLWFQFYLEHLFSNNEDVAPVNATKLVDGRLNLICDHSNWVQENELGDLKIGSVQITIDRMHQIRKATSY